MGQISLRHVRCIHYDLLCVEWDVKLYTLTHLLIHDTKLSPVKHCHSVQDYFPHCTVGGVVLSHVTFCIYITWHAILIRKGTRWSKLFGLFCTNREKYYGQIAEIDLQTFKNILSDDDEIK